MCVCVRMSVRTLQGAAKTSVKVTKAYNKNQIIKVAHCGLLRNAKKVERMSHR